MREILFKWNKCRKKICKFSFSYDSLNTDHIKLDAIDYNAKFGTDNIDVSTFNSYNFRFRKFKSRTKLKSLEKVIITQKL